MSTVFSRQTEAINNPVQAGEVETDHVEWSQASLDELINHIKARYHAFVRSELPRLSALLPVLVSTYGEHHEKLKQLDELYRSFREDMWQHMEREESTFFPLCHALEAGKEQTASNSIQASSLVPQLISEHEDVKSALATMRSLAAAIEPSTDTSPWLEELIEALAYLESDTHKHIHAENDILFPRAMERAAGHGN